MIPSKYYTTLSSLSFLQVLYPNTTHTSGTNHLPSEAKELPPFQHVFIIVSPLLSSLLFLFHGSTVLQIPNILAIGLIYSFSE